MENQSECEEASVGFVHSLFNLAERYLSISLTNHQLKINFDIFFSTA